MKTIDWRFIDGVIVLVHSNEAPTDNEWNAFIADVAQRIDQLHAGIIVTDGPGPNTAQRELIADEPKIRDMPRAIITHSMIAKGIATVLRWFGHETRAFRPDDTDRAFAYIGVEQSTRQRIRTTISSMRRTLLGRDLEEILQSEEARPVLAGQTRDDYVLQTPFSQICDQMEAIQRKMGKLRQ